MQGKEIIGTPIAVIPDTVLRWNVTTPADITADSLALFYNCLPAIDLVLIGTGAKGHFIDPREIEEMMKRGVKVEVMSTLRAAETYNLLRQDRYVGCALLPDPERDEEANDKFGSQITGRTRNDLRHAYSDADIDRYGMSKEQLRKDAESVLPMPKFMKYKKKDVGRTGLGVREYDIPDLRKPSEKSTPGYKFGDHSGHKFVRKTFAKSENDLSQKKGDK